MSVSSTPPFPAPGTFIQSIRDSSRSLRQAAGISIQPEAIKRLVLSPAFLDSFKRVSASHGLALPLNFSSPLAELNLLSILSLLNFGSGYRVPLHQETDRGAWDSIRAFVFSLYLTSSVGGEGDLLSAKGMENIDSGKVAELMRVNVHVERPHESIPGLTIGELEGPLYELITLITKTLNDTGHVLVRLGYPDLGSFVVEALKAGNKAKSDSSVDCQVDVVLERIVRAIPAFQDMGMVNGKAIYCFKKALFLIHAVTVRFGSLTPPPFPIPSTAQCPVFTDNVLPSLLIHLGVIDLSASPTLSALFPNVTDKLSSLLGPSPPKADAPKSRLAPKDGPILTSDQAYILRAAAIDACELIVEETRNIDVSSLSSDGVSYDWIKDITLPQLDMWIWSIAKDRPDYRELERFVLRDTVFF